MRDTIKKYSITIAVGLAMAVGVSFLRSLYWQSNVKSVMMALTDTFSVPGLLLILVGLLIVCANHGAFYLLSFAGKKFIGLFKKVRSESDKMSYYEYREMKSEKQHDYSYLLVCGGVFLIIALVFFGIYLAY